jgi:hypothetical protein
LGRWIFCRRCSTNIATNPSGGFGITGLATMPNECPGCNVIFITFGFISEDVADLVVGAGNHTAGVAGPWVLFYDGGDYTRDGSRPVDCTVGTIVHPTDPTLDLIMTVSVSAGAFVWTRKSSDPLDPDFQIFELTTGVIDVDVCECGQCVSIGTEAHRTPWAYPYPPEDWTADVFVVAEGNGCTSPGCEVDFDKTVCLSWDQFYQGSSGPVDGWGFGGRWIWGDWYAGTGDDQHCHEAAVLTISDFLLDACEDQENGQFSASNLCCGIRKAWEDCDRDPRTTPVAADFSVVLDNACGGGLLNTLSYGGTCEDDGGTINCPPDDCPIQYCKWQWDVDTQAWVLIETNCLGDSECPGPPDDPLETDVVWTECNCCVTVTPGCTCDDPLVFEPCLTQDCTWIWLGTWDPLDPCSDITCECQGRPDDILDPGGFIGEIRDGCCCKEIV